MNYYAYYSKEGRLLYKIQTKDIIGDENSVRLGEQEYEDLNVEIEQMIFDLKKNLADTDYIACKIAEGAATAEEYAEMLAQRSSWRARINELQASINM